MLINMKIALLAIAAIALTGILGACATGASVDTPVMDVGVGGEVL